jgi:hypothetical protein
VSSALTDQLMPNEEIRWTGAPRPGLRLGLGDVPIMLFGGFFTAIALVIAVNTFPLGVLLPHLWVGLYLVGGRFFVECRMRERTTYAITDLRVIIVRSWPRRKVTAINLDAVAEIGMTEHRDGSGTISFGGSTSPFGALQPGARAVPSLQFISEPQRILALAYDARGSHDERPPSMYPHNGPAAPPF